MYLNSCRQRDVPLDSALVKSLVAYDIPIVPGGPAGPGSPVDIQLAETAGSFMTVVRTFVNLAPYEPSAAGEPPPPRILL